MLAKARLTVRSTKVALETRAPVTAPLVVVARSFVDLHRRTGTRRAEARAVARRCTRFKPRRRVAVDRESETATAAKSGVAPPASACLLSSACVPVLVGPLEGVGASAASGVATTGREAPSKGPIPAFGRGGGETSTATPLGPRLVPGRTGQVTPTAPTTQAASIVTASDAPTRTRPTPTTATREDGDGATPTARKGGAPSGAPPGVSAARPKQAVPTPPSAA